MRTINPLVTTILTAAFLWACAQDGRPSRFPVIQETPGEGEPDAVPPTSARFTMLERKLDRPFPPTTTRGILDFANGNMKYTRFLPDGRAFGEQINVDNVTYNKLGGIYWSRTDNVYDPLAKALIALLSGIADPNRSLDYLKTVADDVRGVGSERVRGANTVHYAATADLRKAAGTEGASFSGAKWPDGATVPVEVWVDGTGRVRRFRYLNDPTLEQTWEFYDWGVRGDISPPPPNLVRE